MKIYGIVLLLAALILGGCSSKKEELSVNGWPKRIVFAYVPDQEEPGRREAVYDKMVVYLSEAVGIEVKLQKSSQYGPVIEAMRAKKVDITNLSTFPYLIACKKVGVEPIAARSFLDGSARTYHSIFIARADSKWQTTEELLADAANVRFAFVNPASTSGHLLPRAFLEERGIDPENDFKELVYPGSQSASVLAVLSGQIDAAAVSDANLRKLLKVGKLTEDDLRILGKSPPIPSGCVSIRTELPDTLKDALRQAYSNMARDAPELNADLKEMSGKYVEEPMGDYILVEDSLFDGLRQLSGRIESLAMLR